MASTSSPIVRRAVEQDLPAIHALIDALADYEKLDRPTADARERLRADLFGPKPRIDCHLAFMDGYPVGYTIIFESYSSFLAMPKLYLEDLFVLPEYRGRKVGYALFSAMVEEGKRRGCVLMEWLALDWNKLAIDFYLRMGAKEKKDWQIYQVDLR